MSRCPRCGMELGGYAVCPPHSTETYCSEACAACREHAAWHPVPGAAAPPDGWYRPHSGVAPDGTPYQCVLIPVPPCFLWVRTSPDGPPRMMAWDGGTMGGTGIPDWTCGSNRAEVVAWRPAPDGPQDLVAEAAEWWKRFAERQPTEPAP